MLAIEVKESKTKAQTAQALLENAISRHDTAMHDLESNMMTYIQDIFSSHRK